MPRIAVVSLMLLLGAPVLAQKAQRAAQPPAARHRAFEVDPAKVKWTNFSARDTTVRYSILHVDSASGATQMLFRLPPNSTSPCHWHTASESNMVVQGSIAMRHAGAVDSVRLGVGGFSYVPERMPHQLRTGPTLTIVFSSLDGRFDFHAVSEAQCAAGRH